MSNKFSSPPFFPPVLDESGRHLESVIMSMKVIYSLVDFLNIKYFFDIIDINFDRIFDLDTVFSLDDVMYFATTVGLPVISFSSRGIFPDSVYLYSEKLTKIGSHVLDSSINLFVQADFSKEVFSIHNGLLNKKAKQTSCIYKSDYLTGEDYKRVLMEAYDIDLDVSVLNVKDKNFIIYEGLPFYRIKDSAFVDSYPVFFQGRLVMVPKVKDHFNTMVEVVLNNVDAVANRMDRALVLSPNYYDSDYTNIEEGIIQYNQIDIYNRKVFFLSGSLLKYEVLPSVILFRSREYFDPDTDEKMRAVVPLFWAIKYSSSGFNLSTTSHNNIFICIGVDVYDEIKEFGILNGG